MQVSAYSPNKNQASFGSKRIFPVVVRDMKGMPVNAWFSRLKLSDPVDVEAMEKVRTEWNKNKGVVYADDIYCKFLGKNSVYALELDSPKSLYDRLLCLSSSYNGKNVFNLNLLQSSPNSSFEAGNNRQYKGAGTALMYGLVKVATKIKANRFELCSESDKFYLNLGMEKRGPFMVFNNRAKMADFLKRQKAKFNVLLQKST